MDLTIALIFVSHVALLNGFPEYELNDEMLEEDARIIGGKEAKLGQFPWQVLLRMAEPDGSNAACGGALVSDRYIITAGHCTPFSMIDVYMGILNSVEPDNSTTMMTVMKDGIIKHPQFDKYVYINDIAILKLPRPVNFTKNIQPISLPTKKDIPSNSFKNADLIVTGWGLTATDAGGLASKLRFAHVKLMNHSECLTDYQLFDINESQICTMFNGKGTCNGDSGGPLFVEKQKNKNATLVGVISFGVSDCEAKAPSVYTNVAYFLDWIHSVTNMTIQ